tara:strand:- start:57 stop:272 length:216 start_codon:yes stop_codon:yes gene_type:complete
MINRETHKELCEKYAELKKQYGLGREQYAKLKRDSDYWETQAKTLRTRNEQLLDDVNILSAQLRIWKGTGL